MDKKKIIVIVLAAVLLVLLGVAGYLTLGRKPIEQKSAETMPEATPAAVPTPQASPSAPTPTTTPAPAFKITFVTANVTPTNSDTCSPATTFNATGIITANGAGTANYRWDRSDGTFGSTQSVVFDGAGTKTVTFSWNLSTAGGKWLKLHVLTPVDMISAPANFTLSCPFRVNNVTARVVSMTGSCATGKTVNFEGEIESNAAGDVSYTWLRSDNASGPTEVIHFDSPGTKTVTDTWTISAAYSGWEAIKTTDPNVVTSGHANFDLTCP